MKRKPIPYAQFAMYTALFLTRDNAIAFQQKVITAHHETKATKKAYGAERAGRLAIKRLSELNALAQEDTDKAMDDNMKLLQKLESESD